MQPVCARADELFVLDYKAALIETFEKDGRIEVCMLESQNVRPILVVGPLGEALTLDDLPSPTTTYWTPRRKAEVVAAASGGLLTVDELCDRYRLSVEELASWQRSMSRSGMRGLRTTSTQHYRSLYKRRDEY